VASFVNTVLYEAKSNKTGKVPPRLTDEDLVVLNILLDLLEPFAKLTDAYQANGVTSSIVILALINAITGKIKNLCNYV